MIECRKFAVVALCAFGTSASAQPVDINELTVGTLRTYKTQRNSEKEAVLPLPVRVKTPGGQGLQDQYKVIFSIPLEGLSEGDVLQVSAEMETTNDCGYDVAFGTWVMIGNAASRTVPDGAKGEVYISYPSGYNITNGNYLLPGAADRVFMHHGSVTRSSVFFVPKGISGKRYLNFVAYAQADKLDCKKGGGLKVEKGSGQMSALHFLRK